MLHFHVQIFTFSGPCWGGVIVGGNSGFCPPQHPPPCSHPLERWQLFWNLGQWLQALQTHGCLGSLSCEVWKGPQWPFLTRDRVLSPRDLPGLGSRNTNIQEALVSFYLVFPQCLCYNFHLDFFSLADLISENLPYSFLTEANRRTVIRNFAVYLISVLMIKTFWRNVTLTQS